MTTPPSKRGFLIMPFDTKFDWLRDDILAAGRSLNIVIERADDIFAPGVLLDQVLDAIDQAAVVVGICTGKNANVFFELGMPGEATARCSSPNQRPICLSTSPTIGS